jgi:ribosomal protein S18 acetylase RimI-like enzyme
MRIDPMTHDDLDACAAVVDGLAFFQGYGLTGASAARALAGGLEAGDALHVARAEPGGPAVGFTWVMPRGAFGRGAYLRLIAVDHAWRGRGVGRALMQDVERRHAGRPGGVSLLVTSTNASAIAFYEALGYGRVGALGSFVKAGVDEVLFYKG